MVLHLISFKRNLFTIYTVYSAVYVSDVVMPAEAFSDKRSRILPAIEISCAYSLAFPFHLRWPFLLIWNIVYSALQIFIRLKLIHIQKIYSPTRLVFFTYEKFGGYSKILYKTSFFLRGVLN